MMYVQPALFLNAQFEGKRNWFFLTELYETIILSHLSDSDLSLPTGLLTCHLITVQVKGHYFKKNHIFRNSSEE